MRLACWCRVCVHQEALGGDEDESSDEEDEDFNAGGSSSSSDEDDNVSLVSDEGVQEARSKVLGVTHSMLYVAASAL